MHDRTKQLLENFARSANFTKPYHEEDKKRFYHFIVASVINEDRDISFPDFKTFIEGIKGQIFEESLKDFYEIYKVGIDFFRFLKSTDIEWPN